VVLTDEPAGANCAAGGQRVDSGLDDDDSGTLEAGEIDQTSYVCNGVSPAPPALYVYLANWNGGTAGFDVYDIEADAWIAAANAPVNVRSQLASTGKRIRMVGSDDNIYEYNVTTDSWANLMAAPVAFTTRVMFRVVNEKMYVCQSNTTTLHVYDGAWTTVTLANNCSIAAGKDESASELYIKTYGNAGFTVIDATTDAVARTITDATSTGENTSSGAYVDGAWYTRNSDGNIFALDSVTGAFTDTGDDPGGTWNAFYGDSTGGLLYIHSAAGFDAYDPTTGAFTSLTTGPTQGTLGTIAITYAW